MPQVLQEQKLTCYHCGEQSADFVDFDNKKFCCTGCKAVYELLNSNDLCGYYSINSNPGKQQVSDSSSKKYNILDDAPTQEKLISFRNDTESHVHFYIPYMHCSSCIYLLENMHKLDSAIINSRVNFQKKEVEIIYKHQQTGLKNIALLLDKIGYPPYISLASEESNIQNKKINRSRIYKIGIAGFCFGNIMMLSLPEYFHLSDFTETQNFSHIFNILSLGLSLPVLFYCSEEFFVSAYNAVKQRVLNIDIPIALAILIAFLRSVYEIIWGAKVGYFDSMTGIVFFMLLGRFFQNKTYDNISFERDYKSYFPLGVTIIEKQGQSFIERSIPVSSIKKGMRLLIRQNELIPADGVLFNGDAHIDYSFVTGEAEPISKQAGDIIYAGGKQKGSRIEIEVTKEVSQSYLTSLWNKQNTEKENQQETELVAAINKYFTYSLLLLAVGAFAYWWFIDVERGINAVTTMLIVACPCALLLSATFTYGNVMQIMAKNKMYVKNAKTVERLAKADTVVFDKTGTITLSHVSGVKWNGKPLNELQKRLIASVSQQSLHPLSKRICSWLEQNSYDKAENFKEHNGKGIEAFVNDYYVKLGSAIFTDQEDAINNTPGSKVYVSINHEILGYFSFKNIYREGMINLFNSLKDKGYEMHLISGDNDKEKEFLQNYFTDANNLHFNQDPQQKLEYIEKLSHGGKKVMMIGDGLNDAGALMKSYVGVAVTDDINYFTPACSAIFEGKKLSELTQYLSFAKSGMGIIRATFVISVIYNIIGLAYALTGTLHPVIAAIIMPLSTISIVLFTTFSSNLIAKKKYGLKTEV